MRVQFTAFLANNFYRKFAWFGLSIVLLLSTVSKTNAQFTVTENFRGSSAQNGIIFGGSPNQARLTSGAEDPINDGWLRVTSATTNQKGFAYINQSFPSTLGIIADFEFVTWRNVNDPTYNGADGICIFLYDASTPTFRIGGFGGSLGYAQKDATPGLAGGYVGIGIDEFGNFSNQVDGAKTGGDPAGARPNSITIRGPESLNYPWIATYQINNNSSTTADLIDYNTTTATRPSDAIFYRRITIEIVPTGTTYTINVKLGTVKNGPVTTVLSQTLTQAPPPFLKMGFSASTGGGVNIHEIRNLMMTTPGNVRILKTGNRGSMKIGQQVTYTVAVTNDTPAALTGIALTDSLKDDNGNVLPPSSFTVNSITATGFSPSSTIPASSVSNIISASLDMAANTTGYITLVGTLNSIPAGNKLVNTAVVVAPVLDQDPTNNTSTFTVDVLNPNVDLDMTHRLDNTCVGTTNTYTLSVSNRGSDPTIAGNTVTVKDNFPFPIASISAPGWTTTSTGNNYTFTRTDALASNFSFPSIVATFTAPATGTSWANTANVTYSGPELNLSDNNGSTTLYIKPNAPTASQSTYTYCQGFTAIPLSTTAATGTLKWYTPAGTTATAPTPSTAVIGTNTYYVSQSNGNCESNLTPIVVTVYATLTGGTISSDQTFCGSGDPASFTQTSPTGGSGTYTYQWQKSTDNVAFTDIAGATNPTFDPSVLTVTTYFRRQATSVGGNCNVAFSNVIKITVNPIPVASAANPAAICSGSAFAVTPSSNVGATTYSWTASQQTGTATGFSNQTLGTATQISQTLSNTTNAIATVRYTVTPIGNGCSGTPFSFDVTVNPQVIASAVNPSTICSGTSFSVTPSSNLSGTTYTWTAAVLSGSPTGFSSNASPGNTLISQSLTNNGLVLATVRYTVTPVANGCLGTPFNFDVSVQPSVVASAIDPSPICSSTAFSVSPTSNVSGTTYTWVASQQSGTATGFSNQAVATAGPISQTLSNTTSTIAKVRYLVTPIANGCTGASFSFDVTVNPTVVASATSPAAICSGTAFTVVPTSNVVATTYTWTATLLSGIASGFSNNGTASASPITQTLTNTTNSVALVQYTVTPFANGCAGASFTFNVTVNPKVVASASSPSPICSNSSFSLSPASNISGTSYTWTASLQSGTASGFVNQTIATPAPISQTLINSGSVPAVVRYVVTPIANQCSGASFAFDVTVNPLPTASIAGTTTVCQNSTAPNITFAGANGTPPYTFTYKVNGGVDQSITTVSGNSISVNQPTTLAGNFIYSLTHVQDANSCGNLQSGVAIISINSTPKGFNDVVNALSCGNPVFNYDIQASNVNNTANGGNSVNSSFSWTVSNNTNVFGASNGSGNVINQSLFNLSNTAQQIIYTVTPTSTLAGGCVGNPFTITVNVPVCSSLSIVQTADVNSVNKAGDQIHYTITITNTGNANQNGVVVANALLGGTLTNPIKTGNADAILERGEVWQYSGTYTVTQADLNNNGNPTFNNGKIISTASVKTTELPADQFANIDVDILLNPSLSLVKTGVLNLSGNTIDYSFVVKNNGNVTVSALQVMDQKITAPITLSSNSLAPGASAIATASYTLTPSEKLNGFVSNSAEVKGKSPLNDDINDISGMADNNNSPTITFAGVLAIDDLGSVNAVFGGVAVTNVLDNDKLNGNPATASNVTVQQVSSTQANISIDGNGQITVLPNTPVGSYTLVYSIEDKSNLGNIKQGTVNITVTSGTIIASNDAVYANTLNGGVDILDVLANDTYNGGGQADPSKVLISEVGGSNNSGGKVTLNTTSGKISVANSTLAGIYTLDYRITDQLDQTKFSVATITISVSAEPLTANEDYADINTITGGEAIFNVLANDRYNGTSSPPTLSNVSLSEVLGTNNSNGKITFDAGTGKVNVASNTPAGIYSFDYKIVDLLDPSQVSTATVFITVSSGVLTATADFGFANTVNGGTAIVNVLANDTYNGTTAAPTIENVILTELAGQNNSNGKVTLDVNTGAIIVSPNTPAGVYTIGYQIVDKLDPSKVSTATISITVSSESLTALPNTAIANTVTGGTAIFNVLANDKYNGTAFPPTLNDVSLSEVIGTNTSNGKISLDPLTGAVNVATLTPEGVYQLDYQIVDQLDPSKISTATITVTVKSGVLTAVADASAVNTVLGGLAIANVLANDTFNGTIAAPTLADVILTEVAGTNNSNGKITLDVGTGAVHVAPNTMAGQYRLDYQIIDRLDPSQFAIVSVSINVSSGLLTANADLANANTVLGGEAIANVLANDTYNGTTFAPTLADVILTEIAGTNNSLGKIVLDVATGKVIVDANTPAGIYTLDYKIVDKLDLSKSSASTISITVRAGNLVANADSGIANTVIGGEAIANILINDQYNGTSTAPTLADVSISEVAGTNNSAGNVVLNPLTGQVTVSANTQAGVYVLDYKITDKLDLSKVSTATLTITVSSGNLIAITDLGNANTVTGGVAISNVLANDRYNGTLNPPTLNDVILSEVSGTNNSNGAITLDVLTGQVNVAPNSPAGIYTLSYTIVDKLDASKNFTISITINVSSGNLVALGDSGISNTVSGGTAIANVLANDAYNGTSTAPTLNDVTLTEVSGTNNSNGNVNLDVLTGAVNVSPNTPAGIYTLDYQIVDQLDSSKSNTATITITVSSGLLTGVVDNGLANTVTGGIAIANVLANDTYNGTSIAPTLADVLLTEVVGSNNSNGKMVLDVVTGKVSVSPNTPAGVYSLTYQIVDRLDATKTSTASVTITVSSGILTAIADVGIANTLMGGVAVVDVLANDEYNGSILAPALGDVNLVEVLGTNNSNGHITLDVNTGEVSVSPNTTAGTYTLDYKITDVLDASKFSVASITLSISSGALVATADNGTVNGLVGGTAVANVLANDTFNGGLPTTLAHVNLMQVSTTNAHIQLDVATGSINVAPNTPAGTYTVVYQIVDVLDPSQVKTASVTVTVTAPAMVANNDSGSINGVLGGTVINDVLWNDKYNGDPATLSSVNLTQISSSSTNITLDALTGKINVASGTPENIYILVYQIEDQLNPGLTKQATVTITVSAAPMIANADNGSINGLTGGIVVNNVLSNDTYNGNIATLSDVILSQVSTNHPNITLDPLTGKVNVATNTPAGSYTLTYQIKDTLNPTLTQTTDVHVIVEPPLMSANNDAGAINGFLGGVAVANVLANDTYDGAGATLSNVILTQISTTQNSITLDPFSGIVSVAPNTSAGNYTVIYQIEDKLNPGLTKTASVSVSVSPAAMLANHDDGAANGFTGGTAVINVRSNDTYSGLPATQGNVNLTLVSTSNPNISLDIATGRVDVAPNTASGIYTLVYQIEDKLNPAEKTTATVTINVGTAAIIALADEATTNGFIGGVAMENILANDLYNGATQASLATVTITQLSTTSPNININLTTGQVIVDAGTLPQVYSIEYKITDKLDPTKSSTATITVTIPNWITNLEVTKTANITGVETNGNISYTISLKNNGPASILAGKEIGLIENLPAGLENITYVASGGTYNSTLKTFALSADLLAGQQASLFVNGKIASSYAANSISNGVSVSAASGTSDPDESDNESTLVTPILKGKIALVKTGLLSADGNTITYTFNINNTGEVDLNQIILTDAKLGINKTLPGTLAVGMSFTDTFVYTLSQNEKDAGEVSNSASVTAKTPIDNPLADISGTDEANDLPTLTAIASHPAFTFTKTTNVVGTKAGDAICYTITITNTGNVTLNNLQISDASADTGSINPASIATLSPGQSINATATHTLRQADLDGGAFSNQAFISLKDNKGNTINKLSDDPSTPVADDPTITTLLQTPSYSLTKSAINGATRAGDVINYSIILKNTGNVTLSNLILIDSQADAGSLVPSIISSVGPNNSISVSARHTLTQAEIDHGTFSNQITASAKDPKGNVLLKLSDDPSTPIVGDATVIQIVPSPSIRFTKQIGTFVTGVNVINYLIQVTNTGNVTLNNIAIADAGADAGSITPSTIINLSPLASVNVTAKHTLIQSEIDQGSFSNQASLTAVTPKGLNITALSDNPSTPIPNDATVFSILEAPGITLVKTGVLSADGNTITYTFLAKNTGTVTLSHLVLSDVKLPTSVNFVPSSIAPNQTASATAIYTITQAEKNLGLVTNTARVTATTPANNSIGDISGTTETNDNESTLILPRITSVKAVRDANNNSKAEAGEILTYSITVKNNGTTARTGLTITDPIPANTAYISTSADHGGSLVSNILNWNNLTVPANGEVTVTFKVKVDAIIPSNVLNIANTATVVNPAEPNNPANPTVIFPTEGKLEGAKTVSDAKGNNDGKAQANEIISYSILIKNTGGSALNGVIVKDILPVGLNYVAGSISGNGAAVNNSLTWAINLPSNSSTTLTFDARVVADVNPYNNFRNLVSMTNSSGLSIQPEVIMQIDKSANLTITKELLTQGTINTGDDVMYKITVANTGFNKATNVSVTDNIPTIIDSPREIDVSVGSTTYSATTRNLVWLVGDLALNQTASITFKSKTLASGSVINSAIVKADQPDQDPNNTAFANQANIGGDDILVPSLFTPNGDGRNDTFEIRGLSEYAENKLTIVNRYGNEVFKASGYQNNWSGEGLNEGTYYYLVNVKKTGDKEWRVVRGFVTLIRSFKK